ncbi:MAG: tRNA uridine-5-carboxymethylaminomethyl(34) synthesis enzyme MnmG [Clostridiales bacterium]|nr:tRNA uridine-5-carboxymethylaminomethyl(34) synthesis enzyme MnmG [Candidatus Apopatousia equi]
METKENSNYFDAVVIGAGHAGCEAALALARTGQKTLICTTTLENIAFLACNPSIGGTAKGHLVCEIDALGGEMGVNTDKTAIQIRMLNLGKGPAVHSLRAQADKIAYHNEMKKTLENQENLTILQAEVAEILTDGKQVVGVKTTLGEKFDCKAVVICTGVYLKSRIIIGDKTENVGPNGFKCANSLTQSLSDLGFEIRRYKTGTPPRIYGSTIDYSNLQEQLGDELNQTFSFITKKKPKNVAKCYLTYTNETTHKLIRDNLDKAPMFNGMIESVGPRYCPSIESKIVKFADKDRHQLFLEPESLETDEVYIQGLSTSFPYDIQRKMVSTIEGLENAKIMRYAYAIEYDAINSLQLLPTLEYKNIKGIFCAGQVNGTSGFEEAGALGIIAGINASLELRNKPQIVLKRSDGYIGVLIDDLVTKGTNEPYRMMTSRAEYRLHLRQDNADMRLTRIGREAGLVSDERWKIFETKCNQLERLKKKLNKTLSPKIVNDFLVRHGENKTNQGTTISNLLKRNSITAHDIQKELGLFKGIRKDVLDLFTLEVKYEGYIKRQIEQINQSEKMEDYPLDVNFDYTEVKGLRLEARQKLNDIKPLSMGQASRISGVSPADISVLLVYLKARKN